MGKMLGITLSVHVAYIFHLVIIIVIEDKYTHLYTFKVFLINSFNK